MQGNNEFIFNQATMQKIVQHYLNTVLLKDAVNTEVTSVKYRGTPDKDFIVNIKNDTEVKGT